MKIISEHLGRIIVALACVALLISAIVLFDAPVSDFFGNVIDKETNIAQDVVNSIETAQAGLGGTGSPEYDHNAPELHPDDGTEPQNGDSYENGNYVYTYQASTLSQMGFSSIDELKANIGLVTGGLTWDEFVASSSRSEEEVIAELSSGGWSVAINTAVTDKNQTSYGAILESINGEPVNDVSTLFMNCKSLTIAPEIPSGVTKMTETFFCCSSLTKSPTIPNGVTDLNGTFNTCKALTKAPKIPNGVIDMTETFASCESLTEVPEIPNSVKLMEGTFRGCTLLTETLYVPCSALTNGNTYLYGPIETRHYDGCGH